MERTIQMQSGRRLIPFHTTESFSQLMAAPIISKLETVEIEAGEPHPSG